MGCKTHTNTTIQISIEEFIVNLVNTVARSVLGVGCSSDKQNKSCQIGSAPLHHPKSLAEQFSSWVTSEEAKLDSERSKTVELGCATHGANSFHAG